MQWCLLYVDGMLQAPSVDCNNYAFYILKKNQNVLYTQTMDLLVRHLQI